MIERTGKVYNPLTIIAIFASLVEVGGTAVLPFIQVPIQERYVNFLIIFPFFLVSTFFFTLYRKHYVLYAPSDFHDDKSFLDLFFSPSTPGARIKKFRNEVRTERFVGAESFETEAETFSTERNINAVALGYLAEDYAIARISQLYDITLKSNVTLKNQPDFMFDAVGIKDNRTVVVEVKCSNNFISQIGHLRSIFRKVNSFYTYLPEKLHSEFIFVIAVVTESDSTKDFIQFKKEALSSANDYPFRTIIKTFYLSEFRKEFDGEI